MAIKCVFESADDHALMVGWLRDANTGETERSIDFAKIEAGVEPGNGYWDDDTSSVKEGIYRAPLTPAQTALFAWHDRLGELATILESPVVITRHPKDTREIAAAILLGLHRGMYVRCHRAGLTLATLGAILTNSAMGPTGGYDPADPESISDLIDLLPSDRRSVQDCIMVTNQAGTARLTLANMIRTNVKQNGEATPTTAQLNRGRWIASVNIT